ncbi:proline-rich protein HaeIII subfamily 1-like [Sarcophilus harrisii]|uniref:proline-rich protein HaeIII subfamily 1-like n=1 Tax=Sarcophilus harrisii TaxID=9305 RepID=UPI001301CD71|nr:proline-rich protein HaeIII subfamily 1-like [Sarcophilus harrisii]
MVCALFSTRPPPSAQRRRLGLRPRPPGSGAGPWGPGAGRRPGAEAEFINNSRRRVQLRGTPSSSAGCSRALPTAPPPRPRGTAARPPGRARERAGERAGWREPRGEPEPQPQPPREPERRPEALGPRFPPAATAAAHACRDPRVLASGAGVRFRRDAADRVRREVGGGAEAPRSRPAGLLVIASGCRRSERPGGCPVPGPPRVLNKSSVWGKTGVGRGPPTPPLPTLASPCPPAWNCCPL